MGLPEFDQLINGHVYDFSSIELVFGPALIISRVQSINYEHGVDQGVLRGTSPHMLGSTRGQYDANASLTMYLEDWALAKAALMVMPTPGGFMEKRFPILVTYAELTRKPIVDTLTGARVIRVRRGNSVGPDPVSVDLDLHVMRILEDGIPAVLSNTLTP